MQCVFLDTQPEDEVVFGLTCDGVLALLPVGHGTIQRLAKFQPMMTFDQVDEFMHDDVIHKPDGQLKDFPIEIHNATFAA